MKWAQRFSIGGAPTSGRHCLNLAKRILTIEGFATYRYTAGYCHEPDPNNPLAVSKHGNQMAEVLANLGRTQDVATITAATKLTNLADLGRAGAVARTD